VTRRAPELHASRGFVPSFHLKVVMMLRRLKLLLHCYAYCVVLGVLLPAGRLHAQDPPYSVDQLITLIQSRVFSDERILERVSESCLGFRLDEEAETRLRSAGASDELMSGLREACVSLPYGVEFLRLRPAQLELPVGDVQELRAEPLSEDSTLLGPVPLAWSSTDTAVADVFGNGIVVGKAPGEAIIAARTEGGVEGTMRVLVVPDTLAVSLGKSVSAAAALGVVVPGGGEFYTGNTAKGGLILAGSAAAIAAGFLITSEDTVASEPVLNETCVDGSCVLEVASASQVEKKKDMLVVGAAVAGALWAYGLVDGILTAKKSKPSPARPADRFDGGLSVQLLPEDGIRVGRAGSVDLTLVRLR
jgi:hypothetical protein